MNCSCAEKLDFGDKLRPRNVDYEFVEKKKVLFLENSERLLKHKLLSPDEEKKCFVKMNCIQYLLQCYFLLTPGSLMILSNLKLDIVNDFKKYFSGFVGKSRRELEEARREFLANLDTAISLDETRKSIYDLKRDDEKELLAMSDEVVRDINQDILSLLTKNTFKIDFLRQIIDDLQYAASLNHNHVEKAYLSESDSILLDEVLKDYINIRNNVCDHNYRFLFFKVKEFIEKEGYPARELSNFFQIGVNGLMKGVERYEFGHAFTTFAGWWIKSSVGHYARENCKSVRTPSHVWDFISEVNKGARKFLLRHKREMTFDDVSSIYDRAPEDLALIWDLLSRRCSVSYFEPKEKVGDMVDIQGLTPGEKAEQSQRLKVINSVLATLSSREERVLELRFGLRGNAEHTLDEIGKSFSVTRERIRQIENNALNKLKHSSRRSILKELV